MMVSKVSVARLQLDEAEDSMAEIEGVRKGFLSCLIVAALSAAMIVLTAMLKPVIPIGILGLFIPLLVVSLIITTCLAIGMWGGWGTDGNPYPSISRRRLTLKRAQRDFDEAKQEDSEIKMAQFLKDRL